MSASAAALSTHRAIVAKSFGDPSVLELADVPTPTPGAGQVLVKVFASGINPSDTYVRLGPAGPWGATPHLLPALPYTPHKDGAGIVQAVGEGVLGAKPGDRVYTTGSLSGTCAQFALCNKADVYPLPPRITFAQGACVGVPCATAHRALSIRCRARPGDAVFIHGASGAVGLAAVQLAVAMGCTVVGSAGTDGGAAAVRDAGAAAVVDHHAEGYLAQAGAALPEAKGGKFDIVRRRGWLSTSARLADECGHSSGRCWRWPRTPTSWRT